MPETDQSLYGNDVSITEQMQARIAKKIRDDSQNLVMLTSTDTINQLLSELDADNLTVNFADMQKEERYQDIESVVAPDGTIYLYSSKNITKSQAEILAQPEDIKAMIAEKVRENSKKLAKLTGIDSLCAEGSILKTEKIKAALADMKDGDSYQDIKPVVVSTGNVYLYSETYITNNYAEILVRAEENDPCATIASTVRDESRIYPRPTSIEFFKERVFGINPVELEGYVTRMAERQEFKDIKVFSASTGACYLYSNLYINEDYARSLAEWEEVGKYENP